MIFPFSFHLFPFISTGSTPRTRHLCGYPGVLYADVTRFAPFPVLPESLPLRLQPLSRLLPPLRLRPLPVFLPPASAASASAASGVSSTGSASSLSTASGVSSADSTSSVSTASGVSSAGSSASPSAASAASSADSTSSV